MKKAVLSFAVLSLLATPVSAASVRPAAAIPSATTSMVGLQEDNEDTSDDRAFIFASMMVGLALIAAIVLDSDDDDVGVIPPVPVPVSGG
ncbi:hypothetical protein [Sphingomicrobium lutaoense]|uniref:Uncharacterized protein n=1 Tax=Sphingomicrobium lutaoense TaxID=515949 RepID=A0A839Z3P7_9SPHN|nr:hypothetical protein [Sphingomicrobium lutaoense]MBB3764443.1 hypothetical protein [Sphingomicrobium lutaoense]